MPYIEKEKVAEMRKAIRKALPQYKISVSCSDHCSVNVAIMEGPIEFDMKDGRYINPYHYHNQEDENLVKIVDVIFAEMDKVVQKCTMYEDGDYGSIPNYYRGVSVGKFDRPYVVKQ